MKVSVTDTGNNHTCRPGGWITYIPANCIVEGERYRNCLTCSKRMATEVIPKADHIPVETVTPATCTVDGTTTYQCKDCKHKYSEISSYAQGHSWGTWIASEDGNHSATCTVCGESEASPHIFVEYIPNNDATKDADGTKTATCAFCDATDTVIDEGSKLVDTPEDSDDSCNHICHSTGITSFFWKILRIFWKLFGLNPVCECGAAHN